MDKKLLQLLITIYSDMAFIHQKRRCCKCFYIVDFSEPLFAFSNTDHCAARKVNLSLLSGYWTKHLRQTKSVMVLSQNVRMIYQLMLLDVKQTKILSWSWKLTYFKRLIINYYIGQVLYCHSFINVYCFYMLTLFYYCISVGVFHTWLGISGTCTYHDLIKV